MAFDITGKLIVIYETKQVSEKFSKREFVVEMADGKYPQFISFQSTGDRCGYLDDFRVGDDVRVTFNLRGREWRNPQGEVKYFNSLDVWKIERTSSSSSRGGSRQSERSGPPAGSDDDIPF